MDKESRLALGLAVLLCLLVGGVLLLCVGRGPVNTVGEAPPPLFDDSANGVQMVSPTEVVVTSDFIETHAANLNDALQTVRVLPIETTPGEMKGFQIVRLDGGSLWERFGLRVNDKLLAFNDTEINSPQSGLAVLSEMRTSKLVFLKIERDGAPLTIRYQIVDSRK